MTDNRNSNTSVALEDLPVVGILFETGQRGPIFDALILLAVPLFAVVAIVGRTTVAEALMAGYVLAFTAAVGLRAVRGRRDGR